jgi:membrane-bound metal-dependent hydrolase YbcI (DUF457 family)
MTDLLTHVLLAYVAATALAARYDWLSPAFVTVAMAGALLPDLDHLEKVIPPDLVADVVGVPFSWGAFQTSGPVLLIIALLTLFVESSDRRPVAALLSLGAGTHLAADALLLVPDGRSQSLFWPLTQYQPPSPGVYTSHDLLPLVVMTAVAAMTWYLVRYRPSEGEHL